MIGKLFKYDGVSIPYTSSEGHAAGWYAEVDWTGIVTRNNIVSRQDFHGSISKPTFLDGKIIDVKGSIFSANKVTRGTIRNAISNLFKVEDFPAEDNELKKLEFTDDDGTQWFIWCKVYSMPEYTHELGEPVINFSLQLFAPNPLLLSASSLVQSGNYGLFGGVNLPVELPTELGQAINPIECVNAGNFAAKAKITITGDIVNPKIFNLTSGRSFQVTITLTLGDELVIDTENATAELNGVNILANRAEGSNWLFVNSGTNYFVLTGDDFDFENQNKATAKIEWNSTKII